MAARESLEDLKKRAARISRVLAKLYPKARISLDFKTPWQCLAATILSAQSTDVNVNRVTPQLFKEYPDARAMAAADPRHVEQLIVKTGFFRQKTRALIGAARKIVEDYGGEVPSTMEELLKIPGVGRKTANVILGHVFHKPAFVVDTHVRRLTYRLGFTRHTDPTEIEFDMQKILPPKDVNPRGEEFFVPGFLERDEGEREPPCDRYPWDGVSGVKPYREFAKTTTVGVY